jgi:hypothetical protein
MELIAIDNLTTEIQYLKNKAELLDEILRYYDRDTMNINVPAKWKNSRFLSVEAAQKVPASPRHHLALRIQKLLPPDEANDFYNEHMSDTLL